MRKYDPPPCIAPLLAIVLAESTVSTACVSATPKMSSMPKTPAWPTPQPSRRKRITPMMFSRHGTYTPYSTPYHVQHPSGYMNEPPAYTYQAQINHRRTLIVPSALR